MSRSYRWGALCALLTASCATTPEAPPLGLPPMDTYHHHLAKRPEQVKMRHQVEVRVAGRESVIEGYFVMARDRGFWVHATTPMGGTLFDVKQRPGQPLVVDIRVEGFENPDAPARLARDIRRTYIDDCPAHAANVSQIREGIEVTCTRTVDSEDPHSDDALVMTLDTAGLVRSKCFSRKGEEQVCIEFDNYEQIQSRWAAREIEIRDSQNPYRIRIALVDADFEFDAQAVLD